MNVAASDKFGLYSERALPGAKYVADFLAGRAASDLDKMGVKLWFPRGLDVPHDSRVQMQASGQLRAAELRAQAAERATATA